MSTRDGRTLLTRRNAVRRRPPGTGRKILLGCGIAASVLYAVDNDLLATFLYQGYSPLSQAISALTSPGAPTVVIMLSMIGAGAAAFGRGFRLYSVLTVVAVLAFGAWMSSYAPGVPAGEPTPWMGLAERLMIWTWLLWMVVLAVLLLRGHPVRPAPGHGDPGGGVG